jgi:diguanylate cyclase (GGDEF)-like protein/PAS domain S-box-containing protein
MTADALEIVNVRCSGVARSAPHLKFRDAIPAPDDRRGSTLARMSASLTGEESLDVAVCAPAMAFQPAAIPADEGERLAALRKLAILDTAPAECFDAVTRLAGQALKVPIVLVSLVDANRQWFLSRVGLDAPQTPRDVSFCAHAVFERKPLVIGDATRDPRFARNPLVVGAPYIRAYMGVPLYTRERQPVGTLCAIDQQSRDFSDADTAALSGFARIVEEFFHAKELAQHTDGVLKYAAERERLFRETFEQAAVGIVHTSLTGQFLRVNQRMCDMLGYTAKELLALSFIDITHPEDLARSTQSFQLMLAGELDSYRMDKRFLMKLGTPFWSHISVALKRNDAGRPDYLIAVVEDISQKKIIEADLTKARDSLQEQVALQTSKLKVANEALHRQVRQALETAGALRKAENRLRAITNNIPAVIGYWNAELRCEAANEAYRALYGVSPQNIVGMSMLELLGEKQFKLTEPQARLALDGNPQHFERCIRKPDGTLAYYETRYVPDLDDAGSTRGLFVLETDVTDLRTAQLALEASNAKLHNESVTDYLTGLHNRRIFTQRSELAARSFAESGSSYGLVLLDLDNFKHINDQYGHDTGDDVLRIVGKVLKKVLRSGTDDLAARLGGEEFAVLCCGRFNADALRQYAERVRAQLHLESVRTPKGQVRFTGSFGIAVSTPEDTDWKVVYARADAALYEAKAAGKDRVVFGGNYSPGATGRLRALRVSPGG